MFPWRRGASARCCREAALQEKRILSSRRQVEGQSHQPAWCYEPVAAPGVDTGASPAALGNACNAHQHLFIGQRRPDVDRQRRRLSRYCHGIRRQDLAGYIGGSVGAASRCGFPVGVVCQRAAISLLVAAQPEFADTGDVHVRGTRPIDQERGQACRYSDAAHEADRGGT